MAQRSQYLFKLADALAARAEDLLTLEVADSGNSITGMKGDVAGCVERLRYFAGLGYELQGTTIPGNSSTLNLTLRRALRRGRPDHRVQSPDRDGRVRRGLAADGGQLGGAEALRAMSAVGDAAGRDRERGACLPAWSISSPATAEVGGALVRHPRVKRLSFIGSIRTGMAIQRSAAEVAVKSISLELGGKNPFIVFPDAPVEKVADGGGGRDELHLAGTVVQLDEPPLRPRRDLRRGRATRGREGRGDPHRRPVRMDDPDGGDQHAGASGRGSRTTSRIGKAEGARLVAGGKRPTGAGFEKGFWFQPTVFADVRQEMRIAREEIFGPVLSILRWSDLDQVIEMANSVEYGLTAAVWTSDVSKALRTAQRVKSGYIWINGVNTHVRAVPFGGYKNSGVGRERGLEELYSFTEEKSLQIFL